MTDSTPFPSGEWKLFEGRYSVILESGGRSAYVYLWHREEGVKSHVWLFNRAGAVSKADEQFPPSLPPELIDWQVFSLPDSVNSISCSPTGDGSSFEISWGGRAVARLFLDQKIGMSIFVKRDSKYARRFGS